MISVKTNKPYFTNVMSFYKIYGFNELDHFLEKDFFNLGETYIKKFNFKELFQTSSKALDEIKPKQKVDEEICENEAILKIKFTKKMLSHEWDLFLENNFFDDGVMGEITKIYERLIDYVLDFYKSKTAETYEWNSRRIFEQIGLLFKRHHLEWQFL